VISSRKNEPGGIGELEVGVDRNTITPHTGQAEMTEALVSSPIRLELPALMIILFAPPIGYFVISYAYLALWHRKLFLWDTVIHENGRLTLLGSLFYFDHFLGCVPMVILFSLCTVGGFAIGSRASSSADVLRTSFVAVVLLLVSFLFVLLAFFASLYMVGWHRTIEYVFQRIERDGVMSKGGTWNVLQLSNIPIALVAIGASSSLVSYARWADSSGDTNLIIGGITCIAVAAILCVGISTLNWCGWQSFLNPRWLAHSTREVVTYPLTGLPIALTSVLLVELYISGTNTYTVGPPLLSLMLIGTSVVIVIGQLMLLKNVDVSAMAQKPSFSRGGLSIPYLLCSHVFEHFLDFVLMGSLTGGLYALVRWVALRM